MGALRRCVTKPEARGDAGGGGESAWYGGGTMCTRAPERGDNQENGSGNRNRGDGSVGTLRRALAGESEAANGAVG